MYDAIIVGARCAGSTTAMLLARKGYRVLVVDRARFPSDTMSTHWVHQPGVARLRDWGLLDAVRESGCPAIGDIVFDLGPFALRGSPVPTRGVETAFAPRRTVLDTVVVKGADAAGAEIREGFSVQELVRDDDDAVVGIRGGPGSATVEHGRIVIGADGLHSLVARSVQAPVYDDRPPMSCCYYAYWSDLPTDGVELYVRPGTSWGLIPTNDGLTCLVLGLPVARFHEYRADIEGTMLRTIAEFAPGMRDRVTTARRQTRFVGTRTCPTSTGGLTVPDGLWSAMPATTRTPAPRRASATPSGTPSYSCKHWTRAGPTELILPRRWRAMRLPAMRHPVRSTTSPASWPPWSPHLRRRRRCSRRCGQTPRAPAASSGSSPAPCRPRISLASNLR